MNRWSEMELAEVLSRNPQVRISRGRPASNPKPQTGIVARSEPEKPVRARKYRNEPVVINGVRFDSKKEHRRFCDLKMLELAGKIHDLQVHPQYVFEHNGVRIGSFKPDFRYIVDGQIVIEDVKSPSTRSETSYRLRKKMLKAFFDLDVVET